MLRLVPFVLAAAALASPSAAHAAPASVLGIPCIPLGDVTVCSATLANRVSSWDGTPLDVDVFLPTSGSGPLPLIVGLHGFTANKLTGFDNPQVAYDYARDGYVAMAYSARGQGFSCGLPVSRTPGDCDRGWVHLADARFEIRDTQYLAGKLVDAGVAKPRIGVTGTSYGGGQSLMLAALRNRTMLRDGRLVPWTSPKGVPMEVVAAASKIGWSDLAYALVPTGRMLDYRSLNPYGDRFGVVKQSYLLGLFAAGNDGYYPPPGAEPEADIANWKAFLDRGEPYDQATGDRIRDLFRRYRSSYYQLADRTGADRIEPAPTVVYNAWTDDIMPPTEGLRWRNVVKRFFPDANVGLIFSGGFGHNRASLGKSSAIANRERGVLFARYLKGDGSAQPLDGVITQAVSCDGETPAGPFRTADWASQHPGAVVLRSAAKQSFSSAGGSLANSLRTDPFGGVTECPDVQASRDPGAATYELPAATGDGYTLIGAPTVSARMTWTGTFPEVVGRLWDVGPGGVQRLVTHGIFRPERQGIQTFQIYPAGYTFAAGHRPKLELLGKDGPYAQPTTGTFAITASDLTLELPVHERPDGAQVVPYAPDEVALEASAARRQRAGRGVRVRAICPREDCTVVVRVRVRGATSSVKKQMTAGQAGALVVRLARRVRRALRARSARRTAIRVTATDPDGNTASRTLTVVLRR